METPTVQDYFSAVRDFDAASAQQAVLFGSLNAMNASIECCDRHAASDATALNWVGRDGQRADWSFAELRDASSRLAHHLHHLGLRAGDRISGLLPRTPELLITVLAIWRIGAVYQPLFTAFGPKAIEHRVQAAGSKLIVTDRAQRPKLDEVNGAPPILTVGDATWATLDEYPNTFEPILLRGDDPFLLMFTSGTTGQAKPLAVPLKALVAFVSYLRDAVDLHPEDRF